MQSSPSAGPPESKPKRGLAKLTFRTRSKNNQASPAPQLTHRSSIHQKTSMARKDSRRQSRLAVGKRNSKRVSMAQKRISVGSKISGRSHSPSTPATAPATAPTYAVNPPPVTATAPPPRAKSGGGLLRRLTRHFTSKKTPAPPPPVPVPARLAAKFAPPESRSTPAVPAIVQPLGSNPQSRAGSRSPTPAAQRSKSPAPSTASKNRSRAPSPDRVSLASWRYPPLPPSPIPPSPSFASPLSPSLSSPSQPFGPVPPSPGYLSDSWGPFPPSPAPPSPGPASPAPPSPGPASPAPEFLAPVSPVPAPPAPAPDSLAPPSALAVPEPEPSEPKETVEHESPLSESPVDSLASPQELEVPAAAFPAIPPTPALVQSDTESSAGHQSVMPLTPTLPPDDDDSQVSRGRRPRRKDTPLLLMVPGGDSDAPPSLVEDDEDAWTDDDEGVPAITSKEHLPVVEEPEEIPRICGTPERKPLTVIVPPSGGLAVTVDVTSSPTEMMMEAPTILEPVDEGDDGEGPSNPRWSQAPKTGGIEFILPAQVEEDAPLKTSQSDKPRSQTLDPHSGGGLRPGAGTGAMRRSTTFSKIFNFGSKKDVATLSPTSAESERRPSADRKSRGMSIIRGPSRLEVEANRMPTRAPTVYAMSNAELVDQLDNLRTKRMTMNPGTHTPTVIDDETARVTELAYF